MATTPNNIPEESFIPGQRYKFLTPFTTYSFPLKPGPGEELHIFDDGLCVEYNAYLKGFIFAGAPQGSTEERGFFISAKLRSNAEILPPFGPHLDK